MDHRGPRTRCETITSGSGNTYKFDGTERDSETGNDHTLYRQYAWNYRRWLSPDPGGVKVVNLEDPQTWNLYAYVRDNPTNLTDLSGLSAGCEVGQPGCIDEISMLGARDLYISQTIAPPGAFEKQDETRNKAQKQMDTAGMKAETEAVTLTRGGNGVRYPFLAGNRQRPHALSAVCLELPPLAVA
jgi:RHS repeat-associated protein